MNKNLQILILLMGTVVVAAFGFTRVTAWAKFNSVAPKVSQNMPRTTGVSLEERAKEFSHLTVTFHPRPLRRYDDVKTLLNDSTSVVVGVVNGSQSELTTPKQNSITTGYQINVNTVVKGNVQIGNVVKVLFPGGRLEFENGTTAEVIRPTYWKVPEVNNAYVFFLREAKDQQGVFEVVGGPQGFFKVSSKGHVLPQSRPDDLLTRRYYKMSLKSFLEETTRGQNR